MSKKLDNEDEELNKLLEEYKAPKKEAFLETAKKVLDKHKVAFEKLEDDDLKEVSFGVFKNDFIRSK